MKRIFVIVCVLAFITAAADAAQKPRKQHKPVKITRAADHRTSELSQANDREATGVAALLRAQILLDRAAFSPGEIDAAYGPNLRAAIRGFQTAHDLPASGELGPETWAMLNADAEPVLIPYEISPEDVAGPFEVIPTGIEERAALKSLGFQSPLELLGEKFHVSPKLLKLLNKGKAFDQAGERILVPDVTSPTEPGRKATSLLVRKSDMTVSALDEQGIVIAQFPATAGSEHDPLPIGKWKINGVARNPVFHYNPALFWDAEPKQPAARIAPGPNNPVGVVWIDLSKPHYGIHGTPEPSEVGHVQSHGCIRLTNWDAMRLAGMVRPGMPAVLTE